MARQGLRRCRNNKRKGNKMAKYDVTCPKCESTYTVQLHGPGRDREWKLENFDWTCDECKEKTRQEENRKVAEANAGAGLPALTGSDKQIAWAETIRKQKIATIDNLIACNDLSPTIDKERFFIALETIKNNTSARWWIDNREQRFELIIVAEYKRTEKPLAPEEKKIAEEAKAEAMAEATVRPGKPITETVAEIRAGETFVEVSFPEKREDFWKLIKPGLGYTWSGKCWRRDLKPTNGTPHDRAAETGNRLLAAGYPIRIFDDTLRVHAVYGTFEPESKRWIMARTTGDYAGWFAIRWPRDEDFYKSAKRLRGSKYDKPDVVVPAEQYQEVLDFAEMYQFSISAGAQKVIDTARSVRENAMTASVKAPEDRRLPEPGDKPAVLQAPENVDVDDEFKEEV